MKSPAAVQGVVLDDVLELVQAHLTPATIPQMAQVSRSYRSMFQHGACEVNWARAFTTPRLSIVHQLTAREECSVLCTELHRISASSSPRALRSIVKASRHDSCIQVKYLFGHIIRSGRYNIIPCACALQKAEFDGSRAENPLTVAVGVLETMHDRECLFAVVNGRVFPLHTTPLAFIKRV